VSGCTLTRVHVEYIVYGFIVSGRTFTRVHVEYIVYGFIVTGSHTYKVARRIYSVLFYTDRGAHLQGYTYNI